MRNNTAPIALFVYNRRWHTRHTVEALQRNHLVEQSDLIIFSDAGRHAGDAEQVQEVREYLKTITGFKSIRIVEREENYGLAKSITSGVTEVIDQYGKIIVLEDDLVTSPIFLRYMNDALTAYEDEERVGCIHGYVYPIGGISKDFFLKGADCWGWATWSRAWKFFEPDGEVLLNKINNNKKIRSDPFNIKGGYINMLKDQISGKNNSWAIRWYFSAVLSELYCLYPAVSYVNNIGLDGSGTHCGDLTYLTVDLNSTYAFKKIKIEENAFYKKKFTDFFSKNNSIYFKVIRRLKRIFK